ncbi:MAG TPA: hypothetical protein VII46_08455, partial [Acidimicrobiales bacterium]
MRSDATAKGPKRAPHPEGAVPRRASRPFVVQVAGVRKVAGTTRHERRCGVIDGLAAVGAAVPEGE